MDELSKARAKEAGYQEGTEAYWAFLKGFGERAEISRGLAAKVEEMMAKNPEWVKIPLPEEDETVKEVELRGREAVVLLGLPGERPRLRLYQEGSPQEFVDADIYYDDLSVKLLDPDVVMRTSVDGSKFIDYSNQTLGRD